MFNDHLRNGIVVSSKLWFLMCKVIEVENQMAWMIECAVGNLKDLTNAISIQLPLVAFCREKTGTKQLKVYSMDRLLRLANRNTTLT